MKSYQDIGTKQHPRNNYLTGVSYIMQRGLLAINQRFKYNGFLADRLALVLERIVNIGGLV